MSAPDTREDTELVKLVLAGDTELYAVLVNRYRTRVSRYVERFTHDIEDARDVTQDVFIKVYGALDSFDPRFKFSAWLFRIAGNAAIDHLRRRRVRLLPLERPAGENGEARAVDPPETRPNPHEELTRRRLREALSVAIDRLPDDYRGSTRSTRVSSFPPGCSGSPGTRRSITCGGGESASCRSSAQPGRMARRAPRIRPRARAAAAGPPPAARAPSLGEWRGARPGSARDAPESPRGAHPPAASRGPLGGHRPSARRLPRAHQPSSLRRDALRGDRRAQGHAPRHGQDQIGR